MKLRLLFKCSLLQIGLILLSGITCMADQSLPPQSAHERPEVVLQYTPVTNPWLISFSNDSSHLALNNGQQVIDLWDLKSSTRLRSIDIDIPPEDRYNAVTALALSPDGKLLAFGDASGQLQIWEFISGKCRSIFSTGENTISEIAWSPDSNLLAAAGETTAYWDDKASNRHITVWNIQADQQVHTLPGDSFVRFSNNGKWIAAQDLKKVHLYDARSGDEVFTFQDQYGVFGPFAFSPDNTFLVTNGEDPNWKPDLSMEGLGISYNAHTLKLRVWDLTTGKLIRMLPGHHNQESGVVQLQFLPDNQTLYSGGLDHIILWDVCTGQVEKQLASTTQRRLSPDGNLLIDLQNSGLHVSNRSTGKSLLFIPSPPASIHTLAFSPDGNLLVSGDDRVKSAVRVWDLRKGQLRYTREGPSGQLFNVRFLPQNRVLCDTLNRSRIWDARTGKLLKTIKRPVEKYRTFVESKPGILNLNATRMISYSGQHDNQRLKMIDVKSNRTLRTLPGGIYWVDGDPISPDGRYLITQTGWQSKRFEVWNLETGQLDSELSGTPEGHLLSAEMVFSSDGQKVAGILVFWVKSTQDSNDFIDQSFIAVWERSSGKLIAQYTIHQIQKNTGQRIRFSPDGKLLAVGVDDRLRFYNANTLELTRTLNPSQSFIDALAFSQNGKLLACGDDSGWIHLVDVKHFSLLASVVDLPSQSPGKLSSDWFACRPDGSVNWSPGAARMIRWRVGTQLYPAKKFEKQTRNTRLLSLASH